MELDRNLVTGSMAMLVLKLLEDGDKYGYQMIEELRQKSEDAFRLKAGTLYPLLHSLEDRRYLVSYEQEVMGKVRKYYQITKEGRKHLEEKKHQWQEYSRAVSVILALEVGV